MKLRCDDGVVRELLLPFINESGEYFDAMCKECGKEFGYHDLKTLKPLFKKHTCKIMKPLLECKDFKEKEHCKKCYFFKNEDRCTYLDSDTQLWLSGNEEDM